MSRYVGSPDIIYPMGRGYFGGNGRPVVTYSDILLSSA